MSKTRDMSTTSAAAPARTAAVWDALTKVLFDPYRPELHYMRGPGPKWHERHANAEAFHQRPALVDQEVGYGVHAQA